MTDLATPPRTVDDLDARETLARAGEVLTRRRAHEVEDLELVAHWADLHSTEPEIIQIKGHRVPGGDHLVELGGDGTPRVRELCLAELAIARSTHTLATRAVMADVLDLRHRLPRTWVVVRELQCEPWLARKIAAMSRHLPADRVRVVDAAVSRAITGQAPSRVLLIAQAAIIEADPEGHADQVRTALRERYVKLGKSNPTGLRAIIALVDAGDAAWFDATITRVVEILRDRPDLLATDLPRDLPHDIDITYLRTEELRARALGWLARPHDLVELIADPHGYLREDPHDPQDSCDTDEPGEPGEPGGAENPGNTVEDQRATSRRRSGQRAVLYVHLHQAALEGTPAAVRVEGLGPITLDQLTRLLAHTTLKVTPVIDLNTGVSTNAYEHPQSVRDRAFLRTCGDVFPHSTRLTRNLDLDHPAPYDPNGPPGQTGDHNTAPLTRTHHRAKTHQAYRLDQIGPDEYVWETPHGLHRHLDNHGTHHIDPGTADLLRNRATTNAALDQLLSDLDHGSDTP